MVLARTRFYRLFLKKVQIAVGEGTRLEWTSREGPRRRTAFEVVEFAIRDDLELAILIRDGLVAAREIDNAETRVAQADAPICRHPVSLIVRTAMAERVG